MEYMAVFHNREAKRKWLFHDSFYFGSSSSSYACVWKDTQVLASLKNSD